MRLNSALVSSLLFVSVVLADPHREEQLPPFLNRVEKSIDPTTALDTYPPGYYAGAVWSTKQGSIELVAGTFTVPSAGTRSDLKSFNIEVSISSYDPDCVLAGGIFLGTEDMNGAFYVGYVSWSPGEIFFAPKSFSIKTGDPIGAFVHMFHGDSKTGVIALMNLRAKLIWIVKFRNQNSCPNRWEAQWIIKRSTLPKVKVPNFYTVGFWNIIVQTSGPPKLPDGRLTTMNIKEDNRNITEVDVFEDFVLIRYLTDG